MAYPTDPAGILGIWVGFFLVLAIYSYQLYRENIVYRIAEHIYVGIAFAVVGVTAVETVKKTAIVPLMNGKVIYVVPIILGLMMYTIFTSRYRWLSRYTVALQVGCSIGVGTTGMLIPRIINQIKSTITPPSGGAAEWANFIYVGVGTICTLLYFILTHEHKGILGTTTRIGRYILMIGLGAMFGNTILFRMSMLSGRVEYLLKVLKLIPM